MRVAINGVSIDKHKAGIGHYGYHLIKNIEHAHHFGRMRCDYILQEDIQINQHNNLYRKKYKKTYERVLDEQLVLPFKYAAYDVIHFIDYSSPVVPISKPFIVTIHDLIYYRYPNTFTFGGRIIKQFLAPISLKRAARIITVSENTKKDIIEYFPEVADKIRVIPLGKPSYSRENNLDKIESIKKKYKIEGDYILGVGTIEPRKNLMRLVEAYHKIANNNRNISLVLVGKKGWLYKDLLSQLEHDANKRVIYTDYVDEQDMASLYSGAKVFVYPSLYEGFGLPPLEAMSCGVPVVVSNTSSLPEVVGDAGIYVNPYEVQSIAEGINKVLTDEVLASQLVELGYIQANKFDWSITVEKTLDVYKEIQEELKKSTDKMFGVEDQIR